MRSLTSCQIIVARGRRACSAKVRRASSRLSPLVIMEAICCKPISTSKLVIGSHVLGFKLMPPRCPSPTGSTFSTSIPRARKSALSSSTLAAVSVPLWEAPLLSRAL